MPRNAAGRRRYTAEEVSRLGELQEALAVVDRKIATYGGSCAP